MPCTGTCDVAIAALNASTLRSGNVPMGLLPTHLLVPPDETLWECIPVNGGDPRPNHKARWLSLSYGDCEYKILGECDRKEPPSCSEWSAESSRWSRRWHAEPVRDDVCMRGEIAPCTNRLGKLPPEGFACP